MATVAACAGFAAVCGSSAAAGVTMAKVAMPEMKKYQYSDRLSSGCVVAGGTMGILIPPSMGFILYGILTGASIGHLFMAGILPGITQAIFYVITIYIVCRLNPHMGLPGPKVSMKEKIVSLKNIWLMLTLFLLVILGIYLGVFSPTEAGAVGAFGSIVLTYVAGRLKGRNLVECIVEAGRTTSMIILLIIGAFVFANFMAISKLPTAMGQFVTGLSVSRYLILAAIIVLYILLGMFLDVFSCIIFTVPIFYPVIVAMGFDSIWYGVLMVRIIEIGLITPPVGMNAFLVAGVSGVPVGTIFRGSIPFVIADFLHIILLVAVPAISLYIPSKM